MAAAAAATTNTLISPHLRQDTAAASLSPPPTSLSFRRHTSTPRTHKNKFTIINAVARGDTWTPTSSSEEASKDSSSSSWLEVLRGHVEAGEWREADEETRRLLIELAGEAAQKRGYVFFSEVQYISEEDLKAIDELWVEKSGGRFGYSVQRKIFCEKAKSDFTNFFIKVGWMKLLESSEVVQYNYRAFPNEFIWEISDETPLGHLPLTNALRGTQLLAAIFSHPAFDQPAGVDLDQTSSQSSGAASSSSPKSPFNTTYTF